MQHFLNSNARDLSLARSKSLLRYRTPQPFPTLMIGTNSEHEFFQHADGTIVAPGANTLRVTLADALASPSAGTAEITASGDTATVDAEATAEDLASALNGLASIAADGGVNVTGIWPAFLIAYREVGVPTGFTVSSALLSPNATAELTTLTSGAGGVRELVRLVFRSSPILQTTDFTVIASPYAGWQGRLPLTSAAALSWIQTAGVRLGDYLQGQTLLTVESIDGDSNVTALYQSAVTIRAANYDLESLTAVSSASSPYFTAKPSVTGLVSAGIDSTKLGGLATLDVFNTGTTVRLFFPNDVVADYRLFASTAGEAWPFIVRPYDYNASTNARQWALVEVNKAGQPCSYNNDSALFHFTMAGGLPTAVHLEVDQTGFALPA